MDRINCYFARLICQTLELTPNTVKPFLEGTGLSYTDVFERTEMPIKAFNALLNKALKVSNDASLGLTFGRFAQPYLVGELAFAGINAPNLLESLIGLLNYSALQASYVRFDIRSEVSGLYISSHLDIDLGPTSQTQQEVMVLVLQNYLELFFNKNFTQGKYFFAFEAPEYVAKYSDVFHSAFEFGAAHTSLFIPHDLLKTPSLFYDEVLWQQGKLQCAQKLQALHDNYQHLYVQQVLSKLNAKSPPLPRLDQIASELKLSKRSLNRRLQEEGHHFRGLYQQALQNWASHFLLHSKLNVEEIATELGYQDSNNFRRAFKKMWGLSPMAYRKKHR